MDDLIIRREALIIDDFGTGNYRFFCSRCGRELQIIKVKTKTGEHRILRCSKCKRLWEDDKNA